MSMYCLIKTQFQSQACLIQALIETGNWTREQIEVHEEPQNLYGYKGDVRPEKANIIIRKEHIGIASNDVGFHRTTTGEYEAIISSYDKGKLDQKWMGRLKGNYAVHRTTERQRAMGRTVTRRRLPDGQQELIVGGYR